MKLIIDSNIVISAILNPDGIIANIIFKDLRNYELICPNYLFFEVLDKQDKIIKIANYTNEQFIELLHIITKRIDFIDESLISDEMLAQAFKLTSNIDVKDTYYIALSLQTNIKFWTGDKKLIKGLRIKSFNNIIDTNELLELLKNRNI